ncbi:MAG: hypothetical protein HW390_1469 [Candidatus Brocadiaceae bacterium]|nr:hypothetical protein [Candidatus Brocadiaceae bacterium]
MTILGVWHIVFALGLVIGSFLNVCIYRIPKGQSLVLPRSFCPCCNTGLAWYDNIPLVSYLLLRGRCRACRAKISIRYPLVELLTGYLCAHLFYVFAQGRGEPLGVFLIYFLLACALIVATFVDLELLIIPNEITMAGMPISLALSALCPELHHAPDTLRSFSLFGIYRVDALAASALGIFTGGGLVYASVRVFRTKQLAFGLLVFWVLLDFWFQARGFAGMGRQKLAITVFFVAPFFGIFMAVPALLVKKSRMIPYGPFLSLAAIVCIMMQDYFIELINRYIQLFTILFTGFH